MKEDNALDRKLKIKLNKKQKKITVDYSKIIEKDLLKFAILSKISETYDMLFMINTALDMSKNSVDDYRGINVTNETDYQSLVDYLKQSGLSHSVRKRPREVNRTILGVTTGTKDIIRDVLIAVVLKKGQLDQERFDLLCQSHDFMLGIDPKKDMTSLLHDFESSEFSGVDDTEVFNYVLVDSQWMKFFYTNLDQSFFE